MRIASHLKMSVQRAQFEITSSEFVDWIAYLDEDVNSFHREDYFLAAIAQEVRRSYVKEPMKVKIESFLMKFGFKKKVKSKKLSIKERTKRMKAYWRAVLRYPKSPKRGK